MGNLAKNESDRVKVLFEGKLCPYRTVAMRLGCDSQRIVKVEQKLGNPLNKQEIIDYLLTMCIAIDNRYVPLVTDRTLPESEYIHEDGKRWMPSIYRKMKGCSWTLAVFRNHRRGGFTADEALASLKDYKPFRDEIPTCDGVIYPSWDAVCKHLGYSYRAVVAFKFNRKLTWKEAIEQYSPTIYWSDEDIALLKERYPVDGMYIPELLNNHTANAICAKAKKLGLNAPRTVWVLLDSVKQTYRSAAEKLGTKPAVLSKSKIYAGLSPQECIDRLRRMHRLVDGKYVALVASRFRDDREYLHLGDELWSPSVYYEYAKPEWNLFNFSYRMREKGMSADEALADLEGTFIKGVSVYGTDLGGSCYAYTTEDGIEYRACICVKCGRTLLLPRTLFDNFVHDDKVCIKYEVPDSMLVGLKGRYKMRYTASKYFEEC